MRNLKLASIILLITLLTSCGGKKEEQSGSEYMKPETTSVSGGLGKCFKVVDRNYKVLGDWSKSITVELERTDDSLPFTLTSGTEICSYRDSKTSRFIQVGFGIEFMDEEGNVLDKVSASATGISASCSSAEVSDLVKLNSGEKGSIEFNIYSDAENATQFRISSSYTENEGDDSSEVYSISDSKDYEEEESVIVEDVDDDAEVEAATISNTSSSSKNWDALLDSYEQYVDKYISYMKKAANGDMSALSEYPALMQKTQDFSEQLDGAQGDMTPAQWARYMKITQKMMKAAQEM